ncbi:hypothetical protein Ate01nite_70760 [Actinoplanes teichomyceticus]|nr:hypothetical protein Ate01nite_70760 [Actinoplanes teichomyceticus]
MVVMPSVRRVTRVGVDPDSGSFSIHPGTSRGVFFFLRRYIGKVALFPFVAFPILLIAVGAELVPKQVIDGGVRRTGRGGDGTAPGPDRRPVRRVALEGGR